MKIKATEQQIQQILCNAVNASSPMGRGFLLFVSGNYAPDHFSINPSEKQITVDYYEGRMVKLDILRVFDEDGDSWILLPDEPRTDYQSWANTYPTMEHLVKSVTG